MERKLKVGMIGCGMIARVKHIPALKYHGDQVELAAFSDVNLAAAQTLAETEGAPGAYATDDYRKILSDPEIDVVHVCTPNATHCEITVADLAAGKHVMCEKPMADTAENARKMMEAAEKYGRKLSVSYQNRFRSDSLAVHAYCRSGELGEIYFAKAHALRRKFVPTWGEFTRMKAQGGGPLIDIGTHALDLTLWHMDNYDVDYVSGAAFNKMKDNPEGNIGEPWDPAKFEVEDSAFGFIRMKNGATIFLESAWTINMLDVKDAVTTLCGTIGGAAQFAVKPGKYSYSINMARHGDLVTIRLDDPAMYNRRGETSGMENMVEAPRREMKQWLDAIRNDHEPEVKPYQAYVVCRILEAIYESSRTGRPVFFD